MKRALLLAMLLLPLVAAAQEKAGGSLINQVRESNRVAAQQNAAREARFAKARDAQAALLAQAEGEIRKHEARAANAKKNWTAARQQSAILEKQIALASKDLATLYDAARGAAVDLHDLSEKSLITPQFPDRIEKLAPIAASQTLPGPAELEALWQALALEMRESGRSVTFEAPVQTGEGTKTTKVTRVGPFTATAGDAYLILAPGAKGYIQLERQPRAYAREIAADFVAGSSTTVLLDPSRGALIIAEANRPGLFERLWHSGVGGYFIAAILVIAALIALLQVTWLRSRLIIDEQSIGVVVGMLLLFAIAQWWWAGQGEGPAEPDQVAQVELITEQPEQEEDSPPPEPEMQAPPPPPASVSMPAATMATAAVSTLNTPAPVALSSNLSMPVQISGGSSLSGTGFAGFARGSGSGEGFGRGQGFSGGKPLIPLSTARPQMPEWACKQGIKGWVEAVFTVLPNGRVQDVKIVDAQPRGVYEIAAIESIGNWIYAETDKAREVKQRVPMDPADCAYNWR